MSIKQNIDISVKQSITLLSIINIKLLDKEYDSILSQQIVNHIELLVDLSTKTKNINYKSILQEYINKLTDISYEYMLLSLHHG